MVSAKSLAPRVLARDEITGPPASTTTQLWDVSNATHPRTLGRPPTIGNNDNSDSVAFGRGGILATGGNSGTMQLWDSADPAHLRPPGHSLANIGNTPVGLVAFSPDGRTLASGNSDTVQLWNVAAPARPAPVAQPAAERHQQRRH